MQDLRLRFEYKCFYFVVEFLSLQVPHGLALMEQWDRLCVADRENMRVVCTRAGLYSRINEPTSALTIQEPDLGRVFAVAAKGELQRYVFSSFYNIPLSK